jgi:outer membrane protein OmpA-like peptidoglycan-associated protein
MKQLKLSLVVLTLLCFTASEAQVGSYFSKFRPSKKWSVGLQISPTILNGDVDNSNVGISGGAHIKYSISQSFGLKLNGDIGVLNGENTENTPYEVTNKFKDLNINAVYTLGNLSFIRPLRELQMFTFIGVGAIWSDATGTFEDVANAATYEKGNTSYKGRNLTIPFGMGLKRNFGEWLDLGLEWRTHWVRSDDLDAFNFPLTSNRFSDFYTVVGLQASIKLGAKGQDKHYDWLNPMETIYADLDTLKEVTNKLKILLEDADGDGVNDFTDSEAESECDKVWPNGKVMDSDGDGVNDCKDLQPFSISTEVDENGVALDTDGDGVPNGIDEEPNTAADALVNVRGQAVEMGNACCDCDKVTLPTVMFDNSSSKISPSSYGVLYTIAEKMKSCPGLNVSAVGYTASKSGEQLAYKRVNSIVDHLEANYGIERSRISTGYASGSDVDYSTRRIDFNQSSK